MPPLPPSIWHYNCEFFSMIAFVTHPSTVSSLVPASVTNTSWHHGRGSMAFLASDKVPDIGTTANVFCRFFPNSSSWSRSAMVRAFRSSVEAPTAFFAIIQSNYKELISIQLRPKTIELVQVDIEISRQSS